MYAHEVRVQAVELVGRGHSLNAVSKRLGVSRAAIRSWQQRLEPARREYHCLCTGNRRLPGAEYSYLLGLYLGDGCISRVGRVYALRIACANTWPGLIEAAEAAIRRIRPENRVNRVPSQGCVMVTSYSAHWPCLFPQHGPGRKHERRIELLAGSVNLTV